MSDSQRGLVSLAASNPKPTPARKKPHLSFSRPQLQQIVISTTNLRDTSGARLRSLMLLPMHVAGLLFIHPFTSVLYH